MESDSRWRRRRIKRRDLLKYLILGGAAALVGLAVEGFKPDISLMFPKTEYTIQQLQGLVQATPASGSSSPLLAEIDAATVITKACVPNSKVFIRAGTYTITRSLNVQNHNNVELYGESGTVLKLADGANINVLQFSNANNINIHDLEIDGNRFKQAGGAGGGTVGQGSNLAGIAFWNVTNSTIINCNVHDCRSTGIGTSGACSNIIIKNNTVINSDANGIGVSNDSGGSGQTVTGNTVDGASDVGIAVWEGVNCTVSNNTIRNVTMTRSPFGWQSGEFLTNEHCAANSNNQFRNNNCNSCRGPAFYQSAGNGTVDSNQFNLCRSALQIDAGGGIVTFTNNTCDQIGTVNGQNAFGAAVDVVANNSGVTNVITGNTFTRVGDYLSESSVIALVGGGGTFSNNTVSTDNGKYMAINADLGWTVLNNKIIS